MNIKFYIFTIISISITIVLAFLIPSNPYKVMYGINILPDRQLWCDIVFICFIAYISVLVSFYNYFTKKEPSN